MIVEDMDMEPVSLLWALDVKEREIFWLMYGLMCILQ